MADTPSKLTQSHHQYQKTDMTTQPLLNRDTRPASPRLSVGAIMLYFGLIRRITNTQDTVVRIASLLCGSLIAML
jgi:hypothetical protein